MDDKSILQNLSHKLEDKPSLMIKDDEEEVETVKGNQIESNIKEGLIVLPVEGL